MPRSGRHFLAALAGLAALFTVFGLGLMFRVESSNSEEHRYQSYRYAADKPLDLDPATQGKATPQPLENREPCRDPKGSGESDLCAQWRAAYAAEDSAFWAKWGFWVGLGGMGGLLASLYYTRKAVLAAEEATEDADTALAIAERNAEAAAQMVLASRDTAERQLRPYIGILGVGINLPTTTKPGDFIIRLKNFGRTPAVNVDVRYFIGFGMHPYSEIIIDNIYWRDIGEKGVIDLHPTQDTFSSAPFNREESSLVSTIIKSGIGPDVLCKILLAYDDGFGKRRQVIIIASSEAKQISSGQVGIAFWGTEKSIKR